LQRKASVHTLADPGCSQPDIWGRARRRLHKPALYASRELRNAVKKIGNTRAKAGDAPSCRYPSRPQTETAKRHWMCFAVPHETLPPPSQNVHALLRLCSRSGTSGRCCRPRRAV
jgi:hypothetical protein